MIPERLVNAVDTTDVETQAAQAYEDSVKAGAQVGVSKKLGLRRLLREKGLTRIERHADGTADEKVDLGEVRRRIIAAADEVGVVVSDEDRKQVLDSNALTGKVLGMPTPMEVDEWDALEPEDRQAFNSARSEVVLKLIVNDASNPLQKLVFKRDDGTMLVRSAAGEVYLTGEERFLKTDALTPMLDSIELTAIAVGEKAGKLAKSVPGLRKVTRPALDRATKRASKKAGEAYSLASGDADEDDE